MISILQNLAALIIIVPLIGALVSASLDNRKTVWIINFITNLVCLFIAVFISYHVYDHGSIYYKLGDWSKKIGIEFKIDRVASLILMLFSFISLNISIFSMKNVAYEVSQKRQNSYYAMTLLYLVGCYGIIITNDIFNLYVFLEITSIASYALASQGRTRQSLVSSFEYLVIGTIGASFILAGIGILYTVSGSLNIDVIKSQMDKIYYLKSVKAAAGFLITGIVMKMAIFPLHMWLTNVYDNATSSASSLLGGTSTKLAVIMLIKIIFGIFGNKIFPDNYSLAMIIFSLASLALLFISFSAIYEENLKRILAFSVSGNIIYIIIALIISNHFGFFAAILFIMNESLTKSSLFMLAAVIEFIAGSKLLSKFSKKNIFERSPIAVILICINLASLVGMPLTLGFNAKWSLISGLMMSKLWIITAIILISSLIAAIYSWKIISALVVKHEHNKEIFYNVPKAMILPPIILTMAMITLTIYSGDVENFLKGIVAR